LILNGDIEVDVQRPESPARWPEEDGRCRRVSDTAGGTSFYKARNRDYFLRCTGRGSAATSKLIHIRPGIASLVMAVEIAGMASEEASNVSLEVTLDRRDGSQPRELHSSKPSITASECEGFAIGDASACSPWEEFEIVIDREPSGEAWIVFSAKQPEGNGQVDLLLDHFRITKVK
jgi:hypothetical protein